MVRHTEARSGKVCQNCLIPCIKTFFKCAIIQLGPTTGLAPGLDRNNFGPVSTGANYDKYDMSSKKKMQFLKHIQVVLADSCRVLHVSLAWQSS